MGAVRVGLVGYGNAAKFHVPALRQLGEERVDVTFKKAPWATRNEQPRLGEANRS